MTDAQPQATVPLTDKLVSVVVPAYNEAAVLRTAVHAMATHLDGAGLQWELLVVNDGSRDATAQIAGELSAADPRVRVVSHVTNLGLGAALRSGIASSRGAYVVVMDADLSYSVDHISLMLTQLLRSHAHVVVASPYTEGGRLTHVPWLRATLSRAANFFLRHLARLDVSTLTGMVRAYDGEFIRGLPTRAETPAIMAEILHRTRIVGGRVTEVPAHLDWSLQRNLGPQRVSSMRLMRQVLATVLTGFAFRPFLFFVVPGLMLFAFSSYVNFWMVRHFFEALSEPAVASRADDISAAIALAYQRFPATFIVGLGSMMVSIQLIGLGLLALQAKRNYEDLFHLVRHTSSMQKAGTPQ